MYPGMALPMGSEDYPTLFLAKKTSAGKKMGLTLVWRLLKNKQVGVHDDYLLDRFEGLLEPAFRVERREELSNGTRVMFELVPA